MIWLLVAHVLGIFELGLMGLVGASSIACVPSIHIFLTIFHNDLTDTSKMWVVDVVSALDLNKMLFIFFVLLFNLAG